MARDYKHRVRRKRRTKKSADKQVWGLLGVMALLGAAGASGVYYLYRSGVKSAPPVKAAGGTVSEKSLKGKEPTAATHFDFYTLLPKMEVEISDRELEEAMRSLPKSNEPSAYLLQAGSFRKFSEADGLKARLALIGIVAQIRTVIIKNNETWYRVQIGPYDTLGELKPVRRRLKQNNIDFILLRLTG